MMGGVMVVVNNLFIVHLLLFLLGLFAEYNDPSALQ